MPPGQTHYSVIGGSDSVECELVLQIADLKNQVHIVLRHHAGRLSEGYAELVIRAYTHILIPIYRYPTSLRYTKKMKCVCLHGMDCSLRLQQ